MKWSSQSLGSRFQHGVFYALVRLKALPFAQILLRVVVFYYTLVPWVRTRSSWYLQRRFGKQNWWQSFYHTYCLYINFGSVLLARIVAGITGEFPQAKASPQMRQEIMEAAQNPKGCIVLSGHIGAWQLGMSWLEETGRPIHVVQHRDSGDIDRHYFEHGKGTPLGIINSQSPYAFLEIATALRRGEIVCLMGDRLFGDNQKQEKTVPVPFLQGIIHLPIAAYALASVTQAALVVSFTVWEKTGMRAVYGQRLFIPLGLSRKDPAVFLPFATQFAKAMEEVIDTYPYQFFNFYNIWLE